jgi:hypothetical protein
VTYAKQVFGGNGIRRYVQVCIATLAVTITMSPAVAAATELPPPLESTDLCVGLECNLPASSSYVAEAQSKSNITSVAGLEELLAQEQSGFYRIPALVYRGDVQPQQVVYLAKPGQLGQAPPSVTNLSGVQSVSTSSAVRAGTANVVVIDHGISYVAPGAAAKAAKRPRAKMAADPYLVCPERSFCVFDRPNTNFESTFVNLPGPTYAGTGWHNFGTNFGAAQVNNRPADSLLADHGAGTGTRYCAVQWSYDDNFSNNPIGNHTASSFALLGGGVDRC